MFSSKNKKADSRIGKAIAELSAKQDAKVPVLEEILSTINAREEVAVYKLKQFHKRRHKADLLSNILGATTPYNHLVMSQSRRKPYYVEKHKSPEVLKKVANKRVKNSDNNTDGAYFKRLYESWEICDLRFYSPKNPKLYRK